MDVLKEKIVKIRKPHSCLGCYTVYNAGTEMFLQVVADQGEIWSIYVCADCQVVMDHYDTTIDECYPEGFAIYTAKEEGFDTVQDFVEFIKK